MTALFEDPEQGGFFLTAYDGEVLIARPKETHDGAIPSGNSVAAMVLQRLASLSGDLKWTQAAHRQMQFLAGSISDHPASSCFAILVMMDALYPHRELVCASSDGELETLIAFLRDYPGDDLKILLKTSENADQLHQCAPFTADYPIPKQGTMYYLCENGTCKAPVSDVSLLNL